MSDRYLLGRWIRSMAWKRRIRIVEIRRQLGMPTARFNALLRATPGSGRPGIPTPDECVGIANVFGVRPSFVERLAKLVEQKS